MKRAGLLNLIFVLSCSLNFGAAQDVSAGHARALLKAGSYKEAIAMFQSLLAANPDDEVALQGMIRAEIETGEYASAERRARENLTAHPGRGLIRAELAGIEFITGRFAEAALDAERSSRESKPPDSLRATIVRLQALAAQGKRDEASNAAGELIRYYSERAPQSAEEIALIAEAAVYLERYKDANDLFIDAREADQSLISAYIGQGELLNEKYNYGEASSLFQDALKINPNSVPALLGLAASKQDAGEQSAAMVDRALQINPNNPSALSLRGQIELENNKPDAAARFAGRALAVNPNFVPAIAVRAALSYLDRNTPAFDAETTRALAVNPRAGELFDTLAHFAVINRQYEDGVQFGKRAIELSPSLWSARTDLGIQLLRTGRMAEGRAELERAFAGDPYNVWAKNTLDLLDSMHDFTDTVRGPFIVRASAKDSGAVAGYAADLLEEAQRKLTAKYRFTPKPPITAEVFANHEDFAVRALGLPGLGALGVCFGQVIAMDSPAARPAGEFNWGGTLWHEFTHVITLQMTSNRIPRWFSEGLSVYEERNARAGWGDDWSMERLKAFKDGRFVPISDLDAAFTHPKTPDGVELAYFEASQVCDFVGEKYGFDAILKMLAMYKEGAKDPDVLRRALQLSPESFDAAFNAYLHAKADPLLDAIGTGPVQKPAGQAPSKDELTAILKARPNDYFSHLRLGAIYQSEGDAGLAIEHLQRAADLFPYYTGEGNPYMRLASLYESRGQKLEAAASLEAMVRHDETSADVLEKLARMRLSMGDRQGTADALVQSFYIQPFSPSLHKLAGDAYLGLGKAGEAIREFRVAVALEPADLAGAHYDLALALAASGNKAEAKREVLRALEIAPGFEKAQELLLKLRAN